MILKKQKDKSSSPNPFIWFIGFFLIGTASSGSVFYVFTSLAYLFKYYSIFIPTPIWVALSLISFSSLSLYWGAMYYKDIKNIVENPKSWKLPTSEKKGYYPSMILGVLNSIFVGNITTAFGGIGFLNFLGITHPLLLNYFGSLYLIAGIAACASFSLRTAMIFYTSKRQKSSVTNNIGTFLYAFSCAIFAFISSITTFQWIKSGGSLLSFGAVQQETLSHLRKVPLAAKLWGAFGFIINFFISLPFSGQSDQPKKQAPLWAKFLNVFTTFVNASITLFFSLIESSPFAAMGLDFNHRILASIPVFSSLCYYGYTQLFNLPKETLLLPLQDFIKIPAKQWVSMALTIFLSVVSFSNPSLLGLVASLCLAECIQVSTLWAMIESQSNMNLSLFLDSLLPNISNLKNMYHNLTRKALYGKLTHQFCRASMYALSSKVLGSSMPVVSQSITLFAPQIVKKLSKLNHEVFTKTKPKSR